MKKFEYMGIALGTGAVDANAIGQALGAQGAEGWEFSFIYPTAQGPMLYMKREVPLIELANANTMNVLKV